MLAQRIDDKPLLNLIRKRRLKAGILENRWTRYPPDNGDTARWGRLQRLLANVYLHHVMDDMD